MPKFIFQHEQKNFLKYFKTTFFTQRIDKTSIMLKTHYVGGLLEGKAKGQTKRNTQRTYTINKSNTFLFSSKCLIYLISATFLSAGPHQTSSDFDLGHPASSWEMNVQCL